MLALPRELLKNLRKGKKRLKPQKISSKEFTKKLFGFGYDPDEVEAFPMKVANAYQELLEEREELERKLLKIGSDLQELVNKARRRIEEIFERKVKIEKEIETRKREIEMEIKTLRLIHKKSLERIKLVIFNMAKITKEIKPNALIEEQ